MDGDEPEVFLLPSPAPDRAPIHPGTLPRREFLRLAALALPATALPGIAPRTVTVKTPSGALNGSLEDDVRVFRGVPFAQSPVGPLRFRPPAPVRPWAGTRHALHFAPAAPQPGRPTLPQNEDCLYLNIWAPSAPGPHPVFVWIHGGGFTGGTSFDAAQNGAHFAKAGVVCVTIAYRLGVLGFLDLSPVLGSSYKGSANNALRDAMEALRWVQRNIEAFGGDPSQVTVGGESAGAKLTDTLLGVPSAQGLFHSAISESGGAERIWDAAYSATVGAGFDETWKATGQAATPLTAAAPSDLMETQRAFMHNWPRHFPLRCALEPDLIPRLPVASIAGGSARGKRLLLGTNLDESALFIGPNPQAVTAGDLGNMELAKFLPILAQYDELYPRMTPAQKRVRAVSAEEYWIPSLRVAEAHLRGNGGPAWVYRLDYPAPTGRLQGYAYHSEDVRMVWGDTPSINLTLGEQMHTAWIAFIQGQPPAAPGLPAWPVYNLEQRPTLLLNSTSRVDPSPAAQEYALWEGVL